MSRYGNTSGCLSSVVRIQLFDIYDIDDNVFLRTRILPVLSVLLRWLADQAVRRRIIFAATCSILRHRGILSHLRVPGISSQFRIMFPSQFMVRREILKNFIISWHLRNTSMSIGGIESPWLLNVREFLHLVLGLDVFQYENLVHDFCGLKDT